MAALANDFDGAFQTFAVSAAELFLIGRNATTGGVGTLLCVGHHFTSVGLYCQADSRMQNRLVRQAFDGLLRFEPMILAKFDFLVKLILDGEYRRTNELALAIASEGTTKPETGNLREHLRSSCASTRPGNMRSTTTCGRSILKARRLRSLDRRRRELGAPHLRFMSGRSRRSSADRAGHVGDPRQAHAGHLHGSRKPFGAPGRTITGASSGNSQRLRDIGATEVKFQQGLDP
jgi:hypothetical protein